MDDVKALAEQVIGSVKGLVQRATERFDAAVAEVRLELTKALSSFEQRTAQLGADVECALEASARIPERGEKGDPGAPGADGLRGEKGDPGADGADGLRGEKGEKGDPGADGLRGEKGDPGERGQEGLPGGQGERGERGLTGEKGDPGAPGSDGLRGEKGDPGDRGERGLDGAPGRDALELTILPEIDPEKAYPRHTFATHRGGLIRAIRRTSPITGSLEEAGWQVVVDGVAELRFEPTGVRTIDLYAVKTSGATSKVTASYPVQIHRGIFQPDTGYEQGDCVTFGGSTWLATRETSARPETDDSWRLVVKRGRDGKRD